MFVCMCVCVCACLPQCVCVSVWCGFLRFCLLMLIYASVFLGVSVYPSFMCLCCCKRACGALWGMPVLQSCVNVRTVCFNPPGGSGAKHIQKHWAKTQGRLLRSMVAYIRKLKRKNGVGARQCASKLARADVS